ncbi:serine/threonine-protein phosphatase 2A activator-like [Culicoides brevitarsis]|uniref:serine/threonine-protein phosphatase 2A activator-like n=1 Tax=Culicoides brevitarsis TaxID=469753 RepID=UPI00307CC06A
MAQNQAGTDLKKPETGATESFSSDHLFVVPEKQIKNALDMGKWQRSETFYQILEFIGNISEAVQGKRLTENFSISEPCQKIMNLLKKLEQLAIETPPVEQPQRFGNMAYRQWHQKMSNSSLDLIKDLLPTNLHDAAKELDVYLRDSFGNATRIDYGTGHELNFVMFLMGLFKINVLTKADQLAVGLKVFDLYLNFCRKLQVTYRMEPAGSHGVWSLDDFQFVPFIWGSAQFAINSPIEPVKFVEDKVIDELRKDFMFVSCIDYIRQVKTGNFAEHSNQLWSISAVPSWTKICTGLIKMYQKEVLGKFPVVQHIYFGSLFKLDAMPPNTRLPVCRLGIMGSMGPPPPMPN